jgi:predicted N-formylglutamate amidohydrolase
MPGAWNIENFRSSALLSQDDPPPFRVLNAGGRAPFVIVCDHAGRLTPQALGDLGAPAEAFGRHIALDIGAEGVSIRLAEVLDACAVVQTYSRLVIDCNRTPGPGAVVALSNGTSIPANADLSPDAVSLRIEAIFNPYHQAIAEQLDARGGGVVLISVHSFTPCLAGGADRPWGYGVLHAGDSPFSSAMLDLLTAEAGLPVGDNEPYAMDGTDYTVPLHAGGRGLDYLELEIRQDLIDTPEGQERAAALLARLLPAAYGRIT